MESNVLDIVALLICFIIAFAWAVDYRKRLRNKRKELDRSQAGMTTIPTADTMPPTETGRLKVQNIIRAIDKNRNDIAPSTDPVLPDDSALPDPFESEKK